MDVNEFIGFALDAFTQRGGSWELAYGHGLRIVHDDPAAVPVIANALIKASLDSPTFLDDILSFLPMEQWPDLVERALTALQQNEANESALQVLEKASYQCVTSLHPHLRGLLPLQERTGYSFGMRAFRETSLSDIRFLLPKFRPK